MTFTGDELEEIAELVRLGDPFNRTITERQARQLILMRHVPEADYCLVPVTVRLPRVWIGSEQVSWLWDTFA
jgi:hypothetical protein